MSRRMYRITLQGHHGQTRQVLAAWIHHTPGALLAAMPAPGGHIRERFRAGEVVSVEPVMVDESGVQR